ncbi:MAG: GtrA family protein [Casimicrobiaceae bacterium]
MAAPQPAPPRPAAAPQLLRYAGAGAIGTAVHYALLIALVQLADFGAVVASSIGAVAGALLNYGLNHRFTFQSDKAHRHALPRFALIAAAGIALNASVLAALLAYVTPNYLAAQVIATLVVMVAGYAANRAWTF